MISISKSYSLHPSVISAVSDSLSGHLPVETLNPALQVGYSPRECVRRVFWWVKRNVRFQEDDSIMSRIFGIDPNLNGGRDFLITPDLLLAMNPPMGDCDDFSMLVASMLICLGFIREFGRGWFVTIAADERDPDSYTHVYTKWYCADGSENPYIYIDASHGEYPGWESPKIFKKREWEIR
jgi:hypothetical protein